MMRDRVVLIVLALILFNMHSRGAEAEDPCAPATGGGGVANVIKVTGASGNRPPDSQAVGAGGAMWNGCQGVPNFSTSTGTLPVIVKFWSGKNDGNHVANCGQECGCWAPDGTRTIHVFEQNKTATRDCTVTWKHVIAHELGHALGLGNAQFNCSGCRIMGNTACGPQVQTADCNVADSQWFAPNEDGEECNPLGGGGSNEEDACGPESPVVIDLRGDGFRFTNADGGVDFDIRRVKCLVHLAWTAPRYDDAFLALDRNRNGLIDDGGELFGNYTDQPISPEPNGYNALALFDNGDGRIDSTDWIYGALLVWHDANQNGVSETSELYTLEEAGIDAIYLDYWRSDEEDEYGNELRYFGRVCLSAGSHTLASWLAAQSPPDDEWNSQRVLDPMGLRDGRVPPAVLTTDCGGRVVQSTDVFFVNDGWSDQQ